uniref:Ig-like domain-containing protein n=1 Tax=Knipowitschia caucasica TaxID=637954 RepID=A0AAV2K178_KNICA
MSDAEESTGTAFAVSMAANIPPPSVMGFTGDWSTNWDVFRAEYEDYVLVTGVAEKDKKIQAATLRSVMGSECRHVYRHNLNLTAEQREDPAAILSALERYFKPAKNIIYERYLFGCCKQEDGESIDAFVTRLREKASTCEYGQLKDEMIRDKIVLGIASESSRRRLLREKELNLVTAIEMCRAAEQTDLRMRVMETAGTHVMHTETVHSAVRQPAKHFKARQSDSNKAVDPNCRYCGNTHTRGRDHCPAFGKKCKLCGTNNHFAKVCMKSKRGSTTGKVLCMDGEAESGQSSEEETHLYMIESVSAVGQTKGKKWFVTLKFNSKSQRCQLDSGATCNIMTLKDKKKLSSKGKLRQSNASLRLYSGEIIKSLGVFDTECTIQGIKHKLSFEIEVQEDLQQVNQADYLNVTGQRLEQIRRHTDNDEGLQALRYTVTTGWPDLKEQTSIPVTNKLLEPVVVTGVTEKLQYRRQLAKSFYDRSARVLPELEVGETVRMKPPPGDTSRIWRAGTCLGKVAPRSYLVDMDGSVYRRNRVDLRVAESGAALGFGDRLELQRFEFTEAAVLPSISLLQKSSSSPVTCHATGFFPGQASIFWTKDGDIFYYEDVDFGETLPNNDETFQTSAELDVSSVPSEDWGCYNCVFRLSGYKDDIITPLDQRYIRTNEKKGSYLPLFVALPISGVVLLCAVLLLIFKINNFERKAPLCPSVYSEVKNNPRHI